MNQRGVPTLPLSQLCQFNHHKYHQRAHTESEIIPSKVLGKSRHVVYKAYHPEKKKNVALKVFPHQKGKLTLNYKSESRIKSLIHPNIINIEDYQDSQKASWTDRQGPISLITMELAPHGTLHELIFESSFSDDEILVRTVFHQLVSALEFLHSRKMAHMDLKLKNILVGNEYQIKIADFDTCFKEGDKVIRSLGTLNFRAPEIREKCCNDPEKADVFSLGIILFCMMCKHLPYMEGKVFGGIDSFKLMVGNMIEFWKKHDEYRFKNLNDSKVISQDFKDLFEKMVQSDHKRRWSIKQIKESKWYQQEVYNTKDYCVIMKLVLKTSVKSLMY